MNQVEHTIQRLEKHNEQSVILLTRLKGEYKEAESKHSTALSEAKKKIKDGRLSKSEQSNYRILSEVLKVESPLSVLVRMLNTEEVEGGFKVLSSNGKDWYGIPFDLSFCPCPHFAATHRCSHIDGARLLTKLKYGSSQVDLMKAGSK
jgi:hypothetical protein